MAIQLKRDTAADWTSNDPTLAAGQIGFESDTYKFKIGDGSTAWTSLAYFGVALYQPLDSDLTTWAGITPGTNVGTQLALNANGTDDEAIGYRGIPQNSQSDNYTLALTDSGKHIYQTGASKTVTIPANTSISFPVGSTVTFIATDAGGCTIAITDDTLRWAEDGSTGSVSLAQYGMATALKVTSTEWLINGVGLS
jgi:hypothetical protein